MSSAGFCGDSIRRSILKDCMKMRVCAVTLIVLWPKTQRNQGAFLLNSLYTFWDQGLEKPITPLSQTRSGGRFDFGKNRKCTSTYLLNQNGIKLKLMIRGLSVSLIPDPKNRIASYTITPFFKWFLSVLVTCHNRVNLSKDDK